MTIGIKQTIVEQALRERRYCRRVRLSREGRAFFPATSEEVPCTISDISTGGANVNCRLRRTPYGNAVLYIGGLGRFEGPIVAVANDYFSMKFFCSRKKREKLADMLTIELNRHLLNGVEK